jgi:hypothetical protein
MVQVRPAARPACAAPLLRRRRRAGVWPGPGKALDHAHVHTAGMPLTCADRQASDERGAQRQPGCSALHGEHNRGVSRRLLRPMRADRPSQCDASGVERPSLPGLHSKSSQGWSGHLLREGMPGDFEESAHQHTSVKLQCVGLVACSQDYKRSPARQHTPTLTPAHTTRGGRGVAVVAAQLPNRVSVRVGGL